MWGNPTLRQCWRVQVYLIKFQKALTVHIKACAFSMTQQFPSLLYILQNCIYIYNQKTWRRIVISAFLLRAPNWKLSAVQQIKYVVGYSYNCRNYEQKLPVTVPNNMLVFDNHHSEPEKLRHKIVRVVSLY